LLFLIDALDFLAAARHLIFLLLAGNYSAVEMLDLLVEGSFFLF